MNYKILSTIDEPSDIKKLTTLQLARLASEIRDYITTTVSVSGGHLASNLGIVELTLALHLAFDSPTDQIVFDVSHQCYVHKILTGRYKQFDTLRQFGGISGFTKRSESAHDIFNAGHASTSLSAAFGLAKARDIKNEQHHVIAVIGDGALSGGMAYEALNNIGQSNSNLIIILNDNEMSIDENVGGVTKYLARIRTNPGYYRAKSDVHKIIDNIPAIGMPISSTISRLKESLKQLVVPGMLFEELGITYIGLLDGHDVMQMRNTFERIKSVAGPVLVHVATRKGKGVGYAELNPQKYHGISPFDVATGTPKNTATQPTFSNVFGSEICNLAARDAKICAVTAAMPSGTNLKQFAARFSDRFFDVGIAEAHAVTFAGGLAVNGLKPFFAVYSTFLQRGYDQIIHDICIQNLAVVFCIDRAGLVGNDGETHHGIFDLSYLLSVPNMTVYAPKDASDLRMMMQTASLADGPVAIRYPKGVCPTETTTETNNLNAELVARGEQFTLLTIGSMYGVALEAIELLKSRGYHGNLVVVKSLKPLNIEDIVQHIVPTKAIFTLEDNTVIGGFGSYLSYQLAEHGWSVMPKLLAIDDQFVGHGSIAQLLADIGLDGTGVCQRIIDHLESET